LSAVERATSLRSEEEAKGISLVENPKPKPPGRKKTTSDKKEVDRDGKDI